MNPIQGRYLGVLAASVVTVRQTPIRRVGVPWLGSTETSSLRREWFRRTQSLLAPLLASLFAAESLSANAAAPVAIDPGEYDLTTETTLPHLEEALRYATTHTHQCLREPDATSLFPLLRHQAFTGCHLIPDHNAGDHARFTLQCKNPEAASGSAAFQVAPSYVSAVLELKMGGKNMTLSQRLHGPRVGPCLASDER